MTRQTITHSVLEFWFERDIVPGYCEVRPVWFASTPAFDSEIAERFGPTYERAAADELDGMAGTARGCLALVIVLDLLPRNMFRDSARGLVTDDRALAVARQDIDLGFAAALTPVRRWFLYVPFQHGEALAVQRRSVEPFERLGDDAVRRWVIAAAKRHCRVVERFGRFPHRNESLSRPSTEKETAFLTGPDGSYWA